MTGHHKSFWGFVKLFASMTEAISLFQLVWSVFDFLVMTTISQLQLCCSGNDEGLGY